MTALPAWCYLKVFVLFAVWGLVFNVDPYPERKLYRSLDSVHMYSVKSAELSRHE